MRALQTFLTSFGEFLAVGAALAFLLAAAGTAF